MMLDFFGEKELGSRLLTAIEDTLESGVKTPDLGGTATTQDVTEAIITHLRK